MQLEAFLLQGCYCSSEKAEAGAALLSWKTRSCQPRSVTTNIKAQQLVALERQRAAAVGGGYHEHPPAPTSLLTAPSLSRLTYDV